MLLKKRSNVFSAVTYAVGDLLTKGAKFLLLPLYLVYLSPPEIGALAILQAISLGLTPLFTNGISMAVTRFYQDYEPRSEQLVATLLLIGLVWSGLGTALVLAGFLLLPLSLSELFTTPVVVTWLISGFLRANSTVLERRYIIRGEALYYRTLTLTQFALSTTLIFGLIVLTDMRLLAIAIGELIAYGATLAYLGVPLLYRVKPDFKIIQPELLSRYAFPLAAHAIFVWGLSYADRLVLGQFVKLDQLGVYHIGYLLATVMSTIALSIKNAWLPDFFRDAEDDQETGNRFSAWLSSYYHFMLALATSVICLGAPLVAPFLEPNYVGAIAVMKWVVMALVLYSFMIVLLNPLYFSNRTKTVASISAIALVVNIVAMYLLIPVFDLQGAALASLLGYGAAAATAYVQANRHYRIRLPLEMTSRSTILCGLAIALSMIKFSSWPLDLGWNVAIFVAYGSIVIGIPGAFISLQDRSWLMKKIGLNHLASECCE